MSEWTSRIYNSNNMNFKKQEEVKVYCLPDYYHYLWTENGKIQELENKTKP